MNKLLNKILVGLVLCGMLASTACNSISFGPPKEPVTIRYVYQSAWVDYTEMIREFQKLSRQSAGACGASGVSKPRCASPRNCSAF